MDGEFGKNRALFRSGRPVQSKRIGKIARSVVCPEKQTAKEVFRSQLSTFLSVNTIDISSFCCGDSHTSFASCALLLYGQASAFHTIPPNSVCQLPSVLSALVAFVYLSSDVGSSRSKSISFCTCKWHFDTVLYFPSKLNDTTKAATIHKYTVDRSSEAEWRRWRQRGLTDGRRWRQRGLTDGR